MRDCYSKGCNRGLQSGGCYEGAAIRRLQSRGCNSEAAMRAAIGAAIRGPLLGLLFRGCFSGAVIRELQFGSSAIEGVALRVSGILYFPCFRLAIIPSQLSPQYQEGIYVQ